MDVKDLEQLFTYVADLRRRFLAKFRDLGWEEVAKNREATYNSMHDIFIHLLEVEDSYLHYDIPGKPWQDIDPDLFKTFEDIEKYDQEVADRAEAFFRDLLPEDVGKEIEIEGWSRKATVEQVLLHTFLDEIAHIGELVALMWQMDEEPPWTSIVRTWVTQNPDPGD
ncbi:MAG: DinB family protein [Thermoplasmata archaeon]